MSFLKKISPIRAFRQKPLSNKPSKADDSNEYNTNLIIELIDMKQEKSNTSEISFIDKELKRLCNKIGLLNDDIEVLIQFSNKAKSSIESRENSYSIEKLEKYIKLFLNYLKYKYLVSKYTKKLGGLVSELTKIDYIDKNEQIRLRKRFNPDNNNRYSDFFLTIDDDNFFMNSLIMFYTLAKDNRDTKEKHTGLQDDEIVEQTIKWCIRTTLDNQVWCDLPTNKINFSLLIDLIYDLEFIRNKIDEKQIVILKIRNLNLKKLQMKL